MPFATRFILCSCSCTFVFFYISPINHAFTRCTSMLMLVLCSVWMDSSSKYNKHTHTARTYACSLIPCDACSVCYLPMIGIVIIVIMPVCVPPATTTTRDHTHTLWLPIYLSIYLYIYLSIYLLILKKNLIPCSIVSQLKSKVCRMMSYEKK